MDPIDFRNETWESIQGRIIGLRLAVLDSWRRLGPGTTREVAARAGIDILSFRPRTTELFQLGFLVLVESAHGHEGIYQALSASEAHHQFLVRHFPKEIQPELKLKNE